MYKQSLHKEASEAGITIVNEVGLDPGIDHMLAVQCFDEVREKGGKVRIIYVHTCACTCTCTCTCMYPKLEYGIVYK